APLMSHVRFCLFYCSADLRALHSFPTRRSSDLADGVIAVAGSGGVVLLALVEGDEEQVGPARFVPVDPGLQGKGCRDRRRAEPRSEEHTSELQSRENLVCRLLLEKKKKSE